MNFSHLRTLGVFLLCAALAPGQTKRPLKVEDVHKEQRVADPRVSPDGKWVAYTLSTVDLGADKSDSDIWTVSWDGATRVRMTSSKEAENAPRWSPDGKWLAFLSSRADKEKGTQVWLLPRSGGEAEQLTSVIGSVSDYSWSPDSKRMLLLVAPKEDEPKKEGDKPKAPKPIVITRYHFKQDGEGYTTKKPAQYHLFDIAAKKAERLTTEDLPVRGAEWSADGARIAFFSNRAGEEGRYPKWQVAVADAKPASAVQVLTSDDRIGNSLRWARDGSRIYFLLGLEPKLSAYNRAKLATVPAAGGPIQVLTPNLDRSISSLVSFSTGAAGFLSSDDMSQYAMMWDGNGAPKRLHAGKQIAASMHEAAGHIAALVATDESPAEVYAIQDGTSRPLTAHNAWLKEIALGEVREVRFRTPDNADVHGILTLPPDYKEGQKLPTLLRIHGGPNGQDGHSFRFDNRLFAANGYAVLNVNYRGSSGRDEAFQKAIFADWGNKEVTDLLAGVDHVVSLGIADPNRLGIGGWSYGGILTDYTIAKTTRFKAAISGAGSALQLSMYGSDQYIRQYDLELGYPWETRDLWLKISYPFFEAHKIKTPTLFLGGEKDFNVPIIGSEQMYQALRANGVDSQLIIYPGEFHGIRRPSYAQDLLQRYLDWYKKYLGVAAESGN